MKALGIQLWIVEGIDRRKMSMSYGGLKIGYLNEPAHRETPPKIALKRFDGVSTRGRSLVKGILYLN